MLTCQEAAHLLATKRDRRLSPRTRLLLRLHVFRCKMCQIYGAQLRMVNRVCNEAGRRAERDYPSELPAERKRAMKERLERADH